MPSRITELITKLIATDDASKVIERVSDDLDKLDKRTTEVTLTADDKASDDVRQLDQRLDSLSADDKRVVLRAQARDAQREIDRIARSLADVQRMDDETVKMRVDALGNARAELRQIEEQAERLDREHVDITVDADTTRAQRGIASFRQSITQAGGGLRGLATVGTEAMGGIGAAAATAGAAAAVAIGAFVAKATTDFQNLALEVGKTSDALGIPTEEVSQLKEVSEDLGISFDAVKAAIGRMNRTAESTPGAFEGIGASIVRADDGALNVTETFLSVADALDRIPDAGQRAQAAAQIFGRGWVQIAELITKGGLSIREAMEQVGAGKIVDESDVKDARNMRDAIDSVRDRVEEFANTVGENVMPIVTQLADTVNIAATAFGGFFKVVSGDFDIPVLDKIARYGFPVIGQINAMADAWNGAKKEIDDFRGVTHGTVDPLMQAIAGTTDLNTQLEDLTAKKDPLAQMSDQWAILMNDMRDGKIDTQGAADAANLLAGYLGITTDEVLALADAEIDKQFEASASAAEDMKAEIERVNDEVDKFKTTAVEVGLTLGEALRPLEDGTAAAEAFETALSRVGRSKGLETLDLLGQQREGIGGVMKVIKANKGVIPDLFAVGSESARELNDALLQLGDTYEQDLQQTLEQSGGNFRAVRERARELRQDLRERFAVKLDLDLADDVDRKKVNGMVNAVIPTDREIQLGIKLSKRDLAVMKAQLAIENLQTLLPATALQLQVDLAEGEIGPREAAATAQAILNEQGVNVDLGVNTDAADDELVLFAREERVANMGIEVPPKSLTDAAIAIDAGPGGRGWPPIEVPVKPVIVAGGYGYITGGGAGTFSATATSGLRASSTTATSTAIAPIPVPISVAPARAAQTVVQNIALNAAVIGAPFDVMTAVDTAMRRAARLLPEAR